MNGRQHGQEQAGYRGEEWAETPEAERRHGIQDEPFRVVVTMLTFAVRETIPCGSPALAKIP